MKFELNVLKHTYSTSHNTNMAGAHIRDRQSGRVERERERENDESWSTGEK